jgi:sulfide:quinone oxidoreductase
MPHGDPSPEASALQEALGRIEARLERLEARTAPAAELAAQAPAAIAVAVDTLDAGWVEVHKHTMRRLRFPNVWSLGDCSSLPTSRTGAAIRKQAPILVENLLAAREGREPTGSYDGYSSCPLVTGYGKLILAEFDYDGNPTETFPFDQAQERASMYALKAYVLPEVYWNGMLRGRM